MTPHQRLAEQSGTSARLPKMHVDGYMTLRKGQEDRLTRHQIERRWLPIAPGRRVCRTHLDSQCRADATIRQFHFTVPSRGSEERPEREAELVEHAVVECLEIGDLLPKHPTCFGKRFRNPPSGY